MRPQHLGYFLMLFHKYGNVITGSGALVSILKFIDVTPDEFGNTFVIA